MIPLVAATAVVAKLTNRETSHYSPVTFPPHSLNVIRSAIFAHSSSVIFFFSARSM